MLCRGALLAAFCFLAACEGDVSFPFGPVQDRIAVAGGDVLIAGPVGYCPDRAATGAWDRQPLVVLGSCASVRNNPNAPAPRIPGVLTASVSRINGADIGGSTGRLEKFFYSQDGRSALARDGRADSVRVLSTRRAGRAFILHLQDKSANRIAGLSSRYWRALFDLNGRIFALSVIAFDAKPMSDAYARATLNGFVERVRQENVNRVGVDNNGF